MHEYGEDVGLGEYDICHSRIVYKRHPCSKILYPVCENKKGGGHNRRCVLCGNGYFVWDTVFLFRVRSCALYYRNYFGMPCIPNF